MDKQVKSDSIDSRLKNQSIVKLENKLKYFKLENNNQSKFAQCFQQLLELLALFIQQGQDTNQQLKPKILLHFQQLILYKSNNIQSIIDLAFSQIQYLINLYSTSEDFNEKYLSLFLMKVWIQNYAYNEEFFNQIIQSIDENQQYKTQALHFLQEYIIKNPDQIEKIIKLFENQVIQISENDNQQLSKCLTQEDLLECLLEIIKNNQKSEEIEKLILPLVQKIYIQKQQFHEKILNHFFDNPNIQKMPHLTIEIIFKGLESQFTEISIKYLHMLEQFLDSQNESNNELKAKFQSQSISILYFYRKHTTKSLFSGQEGLEKIKIHLDHILTYLTQKLLSDQDEKIELAIQSMKEILDKTTDVYEQWKVVPNNKAKNIKILQGVLSVYLSSKNYVLAKELYNNFIEKNENLNKFKSQLQHIYRLAWKNLKNLDANKISDHFNAFKSDQALIQTELVNEKQFLASSAYLMFLFNKKKINDQIQSKINQINQLNKTEALININLQTILGFISILSQNDAISVIQFLLPLYVGKNGLLRNIEQIVGLEYMKEQIQNMKNVDAESIQTYLNTAQAEGKKQIEYRFVSLEERKQIFLSSNIVYMNSQIPKNSQNTNDPMEIEQNTDDKKMEIEIENHPKPKKIDQGSKVILIQNEKEEEVKQQNILHENKIQNTNTKPKPGLKFVKLTSSKSQTDQQILQKQTENPTQEQLEIEQQQEVYLEQKKTQCEESQQQQMTAQKPRIKQKPKEQQIQQPQEKARIENEIKLESDQKLEQEQNNGLSEEKKPKLNIRKPKQGKQKTSNQYQNKIQTQNNIPLADNQSYQEFQSEITEIQQDTTNIEQKQEKIQLNNQQQLTENQNKTKIQLKLKLKKKEIQLSNQIHQQELQENEQQQKEINKEQQRELQISQLELINEEKNEIENSEALKQSKQNQNIEQQLTQNEEIDIQISKITVNPTNEKCNESVIQKKPTIRMKLQNQKQKDTQAINQIKETQNNETNKKNFNSEKQNAKKNENQKEEIGENDQKSKQIEKKDKPKSDQQPDQQVKKRKIVLSDQEKAKLKLKKINDKIKLKIQMKHQNQQEQFAQQQPNQRTFVSEQKMQIEFANSNKLNPTSKQNTLIQTFNAKEDTKKQDSQDFEIQTKKQQCINKVNQKQIQKNVMRQQNALQVNQEKLKQGTDNQIIVEQAPNVNQGSTNKIDLQSQNTIPVKQSLEEENLLQNISQQVYRPSEDLEQNINLQQQQCGVVQEKSQSQYFEIENLQQKYSELLQDINTQILQANTNQGFLEYQNNTQHTVDQAQNSQNDAEQENIPIRETEFQNSQCELDLKIQQQSEILNLQQSTTEKNNEAQIQNPCNELEIEQIQLRNKNVLKSDEQILNIQQKNEESPQNNNECDEILLPSEKTIEKQLSQCEEIHENICDTQKEENQIHNYKQSEEENLLSLNENEI